MLATEDFHALRKMKTAITRNNVDIFEAYRTGTGAQGAKSSSKPAGEGKAGLGAAVRDCAGGRRGFTESWKPPSSPDREATGGCAGAVGNAAAASASLSQTALMQTCMSVQPTADGRGVVVVSAGRPGRGILMGAGIHQGLLRP